MEVLLLKNNQDLDLNNYYPLACNAEIENQSSHPEKWQDYLPPDKWSVNCLFLISPEILTVKQQEQNTMVMLNAPYGDTLKTIFQDFSTELKQINQQLPSHNYYDPLQNQFTQRQQQLPVYMPAIQKLQQQLLQKLVDSKCILAACYLSGSLMLGANANLLHSYQPHLHHGSADLDNLDENNFYLEDPFA